MRLTEEGMEAVKDGNQGTAMALLDKAFAHFADTMEQMIIPMTQSDVKKTRRRARAPETVWAPLVKKNDKARFQVSEELTQALDNVRMVRDCAIDLKSLANAEGKCSGSKDLLNRVREIPVMKVSGARWFVPSDEAAEPKHPSGVSDGAVEGAKYAHTDQDATEPSEYTLAARECTEAYNAMLAKLTLNAIRADFIQNTTNVGSQSWGQVQDESRALTSDARHIEDALDKSRRKEIRSSYKATLTECGKVATKRAFLATQLPQEIAPRSVTSRHNGVVSTDPSVILDETVHKYSKLWECKPKDHAYGTGPLWGAGQKLERLTPDAIRKASRLFKKSTATSHDGFHPRHFGMLDDEGLRTLAAIFELCECLGTMPTDLRQNTVALLPKPKGGFRPIGIYTSAERVWARARGPHIREWEAKNRRRYLACAKGSGAADAVWAQTVTAESGVGCKKHVVGGCWDLRSFYDNIDHGILQARGVTTEFPAPLIGLAMASFTAPRIIQMDGAVSHPIHPTKGILAGHGFAGALTSAYYIPCMDKFVLDHPGVQVDIYVDDIALMVEHENLDVAAQLFIQAAQDLDVLIREHLKCQIAHEKTAVVASSDELLKRVTEALGQLAGTGVKCTPNLGIDWRAGRKRGRRKNTVRANRVDNCKAKKKKIKSLRNLVERESPNTSAQLGCFLLSRTEWKSTELQMANGRHSGKFSGLQQRLPRRAGR